jgi:hypothetical protein
MGATHILFKVGQGSTYYEDRAAEAQRRIRLAGLTPFAWMWLTLSDPQNEALIVKRAFDAGYEGFIFDVEEHQDPNRSAEGRHDEATALGNRLRELGIDPQKLYLCSFPNIYWHRTLPYDEMAQFCRGGTMPMVYGTFHSWGVETVIDDWTYGHHARWNRERSDDLPVYPVLAAYTDEHGNDLLTAGEFAPWLARLETHRPTFFSMFTARAIGADVVAQLRGFLPSEIEEGRETPAEEHEEPHEEQIVVVVDSPSVGFLRLRARATTSSEELMKIPHEAEIFSLEGNATREKVGKLGRWLRVRTAEGEEGHVAAWYLRWPEETETHVVPDTRVPAADGPLPFGQSAWIYGMHAESIDSDPGTRHEIRNLFEGTGRRGWVLFTEQVWRDPNAIRPNQTRKDFFWDWARHAGYGVMVRLNHGYDAAGTLPRAEHYPAFAQTCARYCEHYLKHPEMSAGVYRWVVIIGNEQNNPREWPRENQPPQKITPQMYAQAFNLAYTAVKSVLGDSALVVPGAVDPYNSAFRPLDYFSEMLSGIDQLDAIALHTYTHGHDVSFITHEKKFEHAPLTDHYYDFQSYRLFMDRIPTKWRQVPVYITETNPLFKSQEGDWGWYDTDIDWIEDAYAEIHRWNNTPHAQQIQALMLYRWAGDAWTMRGKGALRDDFRDAIARNYRWRA